MRPDIFRMETCAEKFIREAAVDGELGDVFGTGNRMEVLEKFLNGMRITGNGDGQAYYWPTEVDPHILDVVKWEKDNFEAIFPVIASEK